MGDEKLLEPIHDDVFGAVVRLAFPVVVEQLLSMLVGYTDWWLTAQFLPGADYKAAMGLMNYVLWWFLSTFAFISIGAVAVTARSKGAGDLATANHVAEKSMGLGLVLVTLLVAGITLLSDQIIGLLQLEGKPAALASEYLRIVAWSLPAVMIEQIGIACLQGMGDTLSGFGVRAVVALVNLVVSLSLVVGWGPFPQLGWPGLAIGTAAGHFVGGALVMIMLLGGRGGLHIRLAEIVTPDWELAERILRVGIPGGIDVLIIVACHLTYLAIINRQGAEAAAAHGLGVTIESLAYLPGSAFQVAASTLTGQYLGAKEPQQAQRAALTALGVGCTLMSLAGMMFFLASHSLVAIFAGPGDVQTANTSAELLKVVAWSMPSLSAVMVFTGALRGAGDTRWPLIISLIGFLGIRIPGALLLANTEITIPILGWTIAGWGLGVFGAWYAMVADVVVRSLLLSFRFWQGHWKEVEV